MTNPLISVCINVDTRPPTGSSDGLFNGTVSEDFIIDGLKNKINFFNGFDCEYIVFVDEHLKLSEKQLDELTDLADCVILRKHTSEQLFNDWNYYSVLSIARGKYICHFDQDVAAFTSSAAPVLQILQWLEQYDFVCYPSYYSPKENVDPSYNYLWASTRFFICKKDTIDFTEIRKCLSSYEYYVNTYTPSHVHHWMEHIISWTSPQRGQGVFYPPMDLLNYCIFTWGTYEKYTLRRLNGYNYHEIINWLQTHPIHGHSEINA